MTDTHDWPFSALQEAIYLALSSEVQDLSGNPVLVFDDVGRAGEFPYLVIGDFSATFAGEYDQTVEISHTVRAWSQYRGTAELLRILDGVHRALSYRHTIGDAQVLSSRPQNVSIENLSAAGDETPTREAVAIYSYVIEAQ